LAVISMNLRMEAYSVAYANAVAAAAGVAIGSITPDINSLDIQFLSPDDGDDAGNCSQVQLKSTAQPLPDSKATPGCKTYRLRREDYDRLRKVVRVPRVLVVLEVPNDAAKWLTCNPDCLVLKASARWVSLRGAPATDYKSQVPIDVPNGNVFTPEALLATMASLNDT
jgi:Domain of unknown function (DUF4365)